MRKKLLTVFKHHSNLIAILLAVVVSAIFFAPIAHGQQNQDPLQTTLEAWAMDTFEGVARFVGILLLWISSFFVYLAGQGLDFIVLNTVVRMGAVIKTLPGIETGWLMFRDLTNLAFIFALIYTGILMIIDANLLQKRGMLDYRKMLVMLVVAALLVNFSLFFTKALVDISNVAATKLYDLTNQKSLSGILMQQMSIAEIALNNKLPSFENASIALDSAASVSNTETELGRSVGILIRGVFGGTIYFIAGLSFFAISFFLLVRFVLVIYLLVSSPAYFAGMVLPGLRSVFGNWLRTLISQCLFPIVYFFILIIILFFITGGTKPGTNEKFEAVDISQIFASSDSQVDENLDMAIGIKFSDALQYILIIIALIGGLKLAVSISVSGASGADAMIRTGMGRFGGYVARKSFGLAGIPAGATASVINRVPLAGKMITGVAGGTGRAVGYGVDKFGKVTGTDFSSVSSGVSEGYTVGHEGTNKGIDTGLKNVKEYLKPDEKSVNERLEARKKEIEKKVDEESEEKLAAATKRLEEKQLELDRAQQAFRNAKTSAEKAAALDAESRAEEARDEAQEKLSEINKEISRDKKLGVAEWRSNTSGGVLTRAGRGVRRILSPTERAAVSKAALESPKEAKEQLTDKADRLNARLANMIDTGKSREEIIAYLRNKKHKVTPAVMALIKPSLLTKKVGNNDVSPIVEFMTPSMLTAFSKEEKGGANMITEDRENLYKQLEKRAEDEKSIENYLNNRDSDWLPKPKKPPQNP